MQNIYKLYQPLNIAEDQANKPLLSALAIAASLIAGNLLVFSLLYLAYLVL